MKGCLKSGSDLRMIFKVSVLNTESDEWDKSAHAKSYKIDTSPKCAEYLLEKDGCSSFLFKCCLKN